MWTSSTSAMEPDKRIASRGKEPSRLKTHWDYVLEEMAWLAKDFESERKMKISQAKKIAVKVCKSGLSTESKGIRRQKEEEQRIRRLASNIAKDVKKFWTKIEKLILYKHQLEVEGRKKKALDKHLDFLVGQTERYSTMLAEIWLDTPAEESRPPSASGDSRVEMVSGIINKSLITIDMGHKEESLRMEAGENHKSAENSMAQTENNEAIQDSVHYEDERIASTLVKKGRTGDDDAEFSLENSEEVEDDLSTMEADEALITEDERKEELLALERESSLPIEEILKMYSSRRELSEDDEDEDEDEEGEEEEGEEEEGKEEEVEEKEEKKEEKEEQESETDEVIKEENEEKAAQTGKSDEEENDEEPEYRKENHKHEKDDREEGEKDEDDKDNYNLVDAAAAAKSAQPTGFTFSTTKVRTKMPFLLKHSLREYQHIGLDWLVTMYERRLNGILADEMGLGKTIMTISLLAHLACEKGIWGPHLIVVPTSVMLNWETELMKWCPAFKVLTYFGSSKERKVKRQGWSKPNSFHICITTYRLVIQDAKAFKRKKWKYLILDEAHLIKNWKSQRWQTLLNFNSKRRILLTGTPLQNDLMELWSLMHFLMPHIFQSHQQFRDWFNNPITGMVEGQEQVNKTLVDRLHNVLRPFILRRLKQDVEKQLPGKFEHVIKCRLSKRQRNLYEDFMANSDTQATLSSGNFLGLLNVLMQLRKVCNHPDLFEGRPIISSFDMPGIDLHVSSLVAAASSKAEMLDLVEWNLLLTQLEFEVSAWEAAEVKSISAPTHLIEELGISEEGGVTAAQTVTGNSILGSIFSEVHEALHEERKKEKRQRIAALTWLNAMRSSRMPLYGKEFIRQVTVHHPVYDIHKRFADPSQALEVSPSILEAIQLPSTRCELMMDLLQAFIFAIPAARSLPPVAWCSHPAACNTLFKHDADHASIDQISASAGFLRPVLVRSQLFFPDRKLIQFDCGKLQQLAILLRRLKSEGHRALIFTQMTKMLDVLESFVNLHGYTYLRLDGSTKPEDRQISMQRFNTNPKIFLFILSTRSGGVGVNLVGADTVIFYDSDWNPAMDQQAQDRCHRIGQTREVHIYRLISESTIEENILKKANQKRFLDDLVIQSGSYNTDFFKKLDPSELLCGLKGVKVGQQALSESTSETSGAAQVPGHELSNVDVEAALRIAEDEADYMALKKVEQEEAAEHQEFTEEAYSSRMEEDEYADDLDEGKGAERGMQSNDLPSKLEADDAGYAITPQDIDVINVDLDEDMDMLADVKQMAAAAAAAGNGGVSFDDQLCPTEKYAMRFLEIWNPIVDKAAVENQVAFEETEWELDQLETLKQAQEAEIDEDNEPLLYESWDTSYADEAYRQQLEALKQQEYEHQLQLEEEMQDVEREEDAAATDTVSAAEFRSKWKKAKFKSLKGGDVIIRDEEASIHESEAIMDFELQTPVGLFVDSQRKRKHLEEENFTPNQRKRMRVDFLGLSEMEEEREDENSFVALLDYPSLTSDRKSNSFSFIATQSRNLVKLDKEKKKDTLRSGEKIPPADPWMSAEDAVFCAVVHEYGGNWNLASETLAGLPDGGIYRGRYRNPAHCRERFRQLLFKYTSITSAYPMYEKSGASNMPLKVSEDHIRQLLDAVKELPDDEWLLQRHFVAAITSTCLYAGQTTKAYRNSIVKLGNSPHGQSFIRLPKACFYSNTDEYDKVSLGGTELHNTSPSINLVAAALAQQHNETINGTGKSADLSLATIGTQADTEPLEDGEDAFAVDVEFPENDYSELPKTVHITVPSSSSSSSQNLQDATLKTCVRFTEVLNDQRCRLYDQRYRLACKMSAEGESREWAAAASRGLGVVGDHKLHLSAKRRNDSGKVTDHKKVSKKKKDKHEDIGQKDKSGEAVANLDVVRSNAVCETPSEAQCLSNEAGKGSTLSNHENVLVAPKVNGAFGERLSNDSSEDRRLAIPSHIGIDCKTQDCRLSTDLHGEQSFTGSPGSEDMPVSYLYFSRGMEHDPRNVKFRDTEGNDEATMDQHDTLLQDPDTSHIVGADDDNNGDDNDDARRTVTHASESLQTKSDGEVPRGELESSVKQQHVKVTLQNTGEQPLMDDFFSNSLPVPPDLQVSPKNDHVIDVLATNSI